jgi:hypothetical protein
MVISMKGRGVEEGYELLSSAQKEFPQIHLESDWSKAAALVKDLAHEHISVIQKNIEIKKREMRVRALNR